MSKGVELQKHISLAHSNDIQDITQPLKEVFQITYFNYVRLFKNGARIILTDRPDWIGYFYQNALYETNAVVEMENLDGNSYHLWHEFQGQPSFVIGREKFNIDNGITLVDSNEEYTELYYFGSTSENSAIISLYLSNFDVLQRFVLYFKDKAHSLIEKLQNHKIYLPEQKKIISEVSPNNSMKQKIAEFFSKTPIDRFFLDEKSGLYLTNQEARCLYFLLNKGSTAKETGKALGISHRTVESYMESVKGKLGVDSKKQLLQVSNSLGLYAKLKSGFSDGD